MREAIRSETNRAPIRPAAGGSDEGFTQVALLGGLVVVAGLLMVATSSTLESSKVAATLEDWLVGDAATSSAIGRIVSAVRSPTDDLEQSALTSSAFSLRVGNLVVDLAFEGEAGKLNLVTTPEIVVASYLDAIGLNPGDRLTVDASLQLARQSNNSDRALQRVYPHLLEVRSAEALAQDLTSLSDQSRVDLRYASERVLRAIPDLSDAVVQRILVERDADPSMLNGLSAFSGSGASRFTLLASVDQTDGTGFNRRVTFEITPSGSVTYLSRDP